MMDMTALQALAEGYARAPSPEGLDAAAQAALPLCAQVARRFIGRGAEYDDLYQAACLACVRALRVYQPERGVPFAAPLPCELSGTCQMGRLCGILYTETTHKATPRRPARAE